MLYWIKNVTEFLALTAIVLGTFAFGGVLGWGLVLIHIPISLAFCLLLGFRIFSPLESRPVPRSMLLILVMLIMLGVYCLFQMVPLPLRMIGVISPQRLGIERQYSEALSLPIPQAMPICLDNSAAKDGLRLVVLGFMSFYLGGVLAGSCRRRNRMLMVLILMVLLEALYGLGEDLSGRHSILGYCNTSDIACGTFYNRNHFAALLAMFTPISLGWTFYCLQPMYSHRLKECIASHSLNEGLFSKRGLWILVPVVLMLGVIQSASRGGCSSMLLGSALFFAWAAKSRAVRALSGVTALMGLITLVYAYNSDYQIVINRMDELLQNGEVREIIWKNSMAIFKDFQLFGVGLGNFSKIYSRYSTVDTTVYPYQAHNEWLEGFVALGVVGMIFVILIVGSLLVIAAIDLSRHHEGKLWRLGCWCGLVGMGTHCFVEFNLHIPSICVTTFFIVGMLVGCIAEPKREFFT